MLLGTIFLVTMRSQWTQIELDVSEYAEVGEGDPIKISYLLVLIFYTYLDDIEMNGLDVETVYGDGQGYVSMTMMVMSYKDSKILGSKIFDLHK